MTDLKAAAELYRSRHRCECSEDEACRFVRQRNAALSALASATKSLETLAQAGRGDSTLEDIIDVRPYAESRARVAREALKHLQQEIESTRFTPDEEPNANL